MYPAIAETRRKQERIRKQEIVRKQEIIRKQEEINIVSLPADADTTLFTTNHTLAEAFLRRHQY